MRLATRTAGSARSPWTAIRRRRPAEIETAERRNGAYLPMGFEDYLRIRDWTRTAGAKRQAWGNPSRGAADSRTFGAPRLILGRLRGELRPLVQRAAGRVSLLGDGAGSQWSHGVGRCRQAFAQTRCRRIKRRRVRELLPVASEPSCPVGSLSGIGRFSYIGNSDTANGKPE